MISINEQKIEINWVLPQLAEAVLLIKEHEYSIRGYKIIIDGKYGIFLDQLRVLYNLSPQLHEIRPAVSAYQKMNLKSLAETDNLMENLTRVSPLSQDCQNFTYLYKRLTEKYSRSLQAINDILLNKNL